VTRRVVGVFCVFSCATIITIEDGTVKVVLILEFAAQHQYATTVRILGIPDEFIEHGTVAELQHYCGIDVKSLEQLFKF
jgi:1-deoxy-D-xylulose-5-phosphate synthase